jgi:hypothetical protein
VTSSSSSSSSSLLTSSCYSLSPSLSTQATQKKPNMIFLNDLDVLDD